MRGLVIFADGFEDTEAVATIDVLKRAKLDLDYASLMDSLEINTQNGLKILANVFLKDIKPEDYNFIVIPGGAAVFKVLDKSELLTQFILDFADKEKLVAAICAGPSQVGKLGLYKNNSYTCFPGTEEAITAGKYLKNKGVVLSNHYITAKSMAYSIDFGLEIVEYLLGKEKRETVRKAVFAEE